MYLTTSAFRNSPTKNPCDPFQTAVINMNEEENDVMVFGEYFYDGRMTQPYN
jgi:hypothetical protein